MFSITPHHNFAPGLDGHRIHLDMASYTLIIKDIHHVRGDAPLSIAYFKDLERSGCFVQVFSLCLSMEFPGLQNLHRCFFIPEILPPTPIPQAKGMKQEGGRAKFPGKS